MQLTLLQGYPDDMGRRFAWVGYGAGPTSYVNTGTASTSGDSVSLPGFKEYIDAIVGGVLSVSGTYEARPMPSASGVRSTWKLRYFVVSTGAEVANAVNLSAETFQVAGFGGNY